MNTTDDIARRIALVRRLLCDNSNTLFAARLGKSRQHVSALCHGKSHAGKQTLDLILAAFPTVRREWLYFGHGSMLTNTTEAASNAASIFSDISDTLSILAHHFQRLASCANPFAS